MATKYILVSFPHAAFGAVDKQSALSSLATITSSSNGTALPFDIPEFKIGTLDALVQQADDLAKLEQACGAVISKVSDALSSILDGDEQKVDQQKTVNDKPTDQYVSHFTWNKVRYRSDKSLGELIDMLQTELTTVDNDTRSKFTQYNTVKTNLANLQRKQTGNLATKSLTPIVNPSILVQDSEYLETHLIAVPNGAKKDFLRAYETLAPMVVPRSSIEVAQDDEFVLFAVVTFKKHSAEFLQKCREQKWTPRNYKHVEGGKEGEKQELDRVGREEKKVWGEALRIGRTGWSEAAMIWLHVLALRAFVEAVLRYGLPLDYVSSLIKATPKASSKVKSTLDERFSYLAGNAVGKDKKGRATKDDASLTSEMSGAGLGGDGNEYTAYVYYEFEFP